MRAGLVFGALCLAVTSSAVHAGGRSASPPVTQDAGQSLGEAVKGLDAREPRDRRRAVQALAAIGSFQAYAVLFTRGLEDSEPMVADEAQLALGAIQEERSAELAFARQVQGNRSALVRLRAFEALGRMAVQFEAERWNALLKERDPRALRTAVESLGLAAAAGRLTGERDALVKTVTRLADRGDAATRAAALVTLAELDAGAARKAAAAVKAKDDSVVAVAALDATLRAAPEAAMERLRTALDDPEPRVRARAVARLRERGDKAAWQCLAAHLPQEARRRIAADIVDGLRAVSGLRHGANARPWQAWLDTLPDGPDRLTAANAAEAPSSAAEEERTTTFVGHAVRSDRVTFVIDMSGSMWTVANGESRKARVERELRKALEGLPPTARFNVLPFHDTPWPWSNGLVDATPANIAEALKAFERNTTRGKGDIWGAFMRALEDPEVDTLVLLSDGAPSGGERWHVELMQLLYAREHRLSGVAVDVVLFGGSKTLAKSWTKFAEAFGGRLTEVSL